MTSTEPGRGFRSPQQRIRAARVRFRAMVARAREIAAWRPVSRAQATEIGNAIARIDLALGEQLETHLTGLKTLTELKTRLNELENRSAFHHERTMHVLRIVRDDDARARAKLWELRSSREYELAFEESEPLVTIVVPTYINWQQLRERALPSVLNQTYERFECIVVGDAAPPETARAVNSFGDRRLRFVNLPYRGPYPPDKTDAWCVTATIPYNTGWALANGRWLGTVDDDDALRPSYIESLLALAKAEQAEVPYGRFDRHEPDGAATVFGTFPPEFGSWNLQCSLFHAGLRFMSHESTDWVFRVPHDWGLAERMLRIGVRFAMLEESVVDYYPSFMWTGQPERQV